MIPDKIKDFLSILKAGLEGIDPSKIYTITVPLKSEDSELVFWDVMYTIYKDFLYRDNRWHLFFEGKYNELRVSGRYLHRALEILNSEFTEVTHKVWIDGHPIVEEHKEFFAYIFHYYSIINITNLLRDSDDKEIDDDFIMSFGDRVLHCFMNMISPGARNSTNLSRYNPIGFEAILTSQIAVGRSYYNGYLTGAESAKRLEVKEDDSC